MAIEATRLRGHKRSVLCCAASPTTPHLIASSGEDGSVYWFDLRCKENASVMELGKEPVASVCFSPGNDDILYAAYGNTATCLDMRMAPSSGQLQKYTSSALLQNSTARPLTDLGPTVGADEPLIQGPSGGSKSSLGISTIQELKKNRFSVPMPVIGKSTDLDRKSKSLLEEDFSVRDCEGTKKIPLAFVFVDEIDAIGRQTGLLLERRDSYLHEAEYLATTKS